MDLWGWKRNKAVVFNIVLIIVLSMPAILGFGPWSGIQILGEGTNIMDLEDFYHFQQYPAAWFRSLRHFLCI